jgi:hypothetical protein
MAWVARVAHRLTSDIYGGNAMRLTFFLLADLLAGNPVLPTASDQSLWLERRERS